MGKIKPVFILIMFFVFFLSFHKLCHAVWMEPSSFSFSYIGQTSYLSVYDEGDVTMDITNQCNYSINNPAVATIIKSGRRRLVTARGNGNTTIIITVYGRSYNVPVSVAVPLPPQTGISAEPESIRPEESSILSWTSTEANSATIDQGIGSVPVNGTITVSPSETITYTITATGPYGTATDSATLNVIPVPTVVISAAPETISSGESSTLTWSSNHADSAMIDQGIGSVPVNGTINVSPTETTSYTITVTGPSGTATAAVTVVHTTTVEMSANPETIPGGESSTLTWSTIDADSCVIEPGIGSVALNGSITVSPIETTTYTITATRPGGTSVDNVTVAVSYTKPGIYYEYDALGRIKKIIKVPSQ